MSGSVWNYSCKLDVNGGVDLEELIWRFLKQFCSYDFGAPKVVHTCLNEMIYSSKDISLSLSFVLRSVPCSQSLVPQSVSYK